MCDDEVAERFRAGDRQLLIGHDMAAFFAAVVLVGRGYELSVTGLLQASCKETVTKRLLASAAEIPSL
jgi:hypothetical protein